MISETIGTGNVTNSTGHLKTNNNNAKRGFSFIDQVDLYDRKRGNEFSCINSIIYCGVRRLERNENRRTNGYAFTMRFD
jgi:hypothetical protein